MNRRGFLRRSVAIAAAAPLTNLQTAAQAIAGSDRVIRFGLTPVFLSNDLALLENLERYLARATGYQVELVQKRTYQEITTLLVAGQLDAAWICGFPYIRFRESLELLSVPVWRGRPVYQSYLIAAPDREAGGIDDLRGDLHCFSDPDSNSGYLVTSALLAERQTRPNVFFKETFFAYGHRNVVRAVASRLAQSGSVDGYVWEVLNKIESELTRETKVITKSEWLGFPPIACPKAFAGSEKTEALRKALFFMHKDTLGRQVLELLELDMFGPPDSVGFEMIAAKYRKVLDFG